MSEGGICGLILEQLAITRVTRLTLRTSCFLHSWFFLKSAVRRSGSEAVLAWLWLCCGRGGPLVASSHPSPEHGRALPPHPRVTSPPSVPSAAGRRGGRVNVHQMLLRDFAGLIFCFRVTLVHLCVWKPSQRSSGAGSQRLFCFFPGSWAW